MDGRIQFPAFNERRQKIRHPYAVRELQELRNEFKELDQTTSSTRDAQYTKVASDYKRGYKFFRTEVNIASIKGKLIVLSEAIGVASCDFNFDLHFSCDHPYQLEREELCVLRIGPLSDYEAEFNEKLEMSFAW